MKKNNLKVLLLTSKSDTRDFYVASAPPMGLYRLRNYLLQKGINCDILDLSIQPGLEEKYCQMLEQGVYDIVGMSVTHHNMVPELETLWKFRMASKKSGKKCLFIAGGQEATLNYKQWLEIGIDLVLLGFAEKTLYELCLRFPDLAEFEVSEIVEGMDGYAVRDKNSQLIYRPKKVLTKTEFEEFSFVQVLKLDIPYELYWDNLRLAAPSFNFHGNKFVAETVRLYTTSHCPLVCGYCSSRSFILESQKQISPVIMLSASQVFQLLMHYIKKYGAKGFLFSDDTFLIGSKEGIRRAFNLCRLIIEAKNNNSIPKDMVFNIQARVDEFIMLNQQSERVVNWELIKAMKDAGFSGIGLGVETFSDRLLHCPSINKPIYSEEMCRKVLDALLESGLNPTFNMILMVPESTVEDLIHSMRIAVEYFQKGSQPAVTTLMDSFPGSLIHGCRDYEVTMKEWRNPYSGEIVAISDYFIPKDKTLFGIIGQIRTTAFTEQEKIKQECSWKYPVIPKPVTGLSILMAIAKLLGQYELADQIKDIIYASIAKYFSERTAKEETCFREAQ